MILVIFNALILVHADKVGIMNHYFSDFRHWWCNKRNHWCWSHLLVKIL